MGCAEADSLSVQKFGDGPGAFRNGVDGADGGDLVLRTSAAPAATSRARMSIDLPTWADVFGLMTSSRGIGVRQRRKRNQPTRNRLAAEASNL